MMHGYVRTTDRIVLPDASAYTDYRKGSDNITGMTGSP